MSLGSQATARPKSLARHRMLALARLIVVLAVGAFCLRVGPGLAQTQAQRPASPAANDGSQSFGRKLSRMRSMTNEQRKAVAKRQSAIREAAGTAKGAPRVQITGNNCGLTQGTIPNYFGCGNYANSPLPSYSLDANGFPINITGGIRKFVNKLPGLGAANANEIGQYIPVATPDTTTYPGSDYYELGVVQYREQLHPDLPAVAAGGATGGTLLRAYRDLRGGGQDAQGNWIPGAPQYLGPLIIAQRDRPTRLKVFNQLPTTQPGPPSLTNGKLFIPVDITNMGAGTGPTGILYTDNRSVVHLHGGNTPWISDGTPHQWTTPAAEVLPDLMRKGVSFENVPDMGTPKGTPNDGIATHYYTNQQSARLMFYHDHVYGITRLNVYAGLAAGYLITDPQEEGLIDTGILPNLGGVYRHGIPLVIQDKGFVPPMDQLMSQDPTWVALGMPTDVGSLWFPHVYNPNQWPQASDRSGANAFGRWDYGPWFWPPLASLSNPLGMTVPDIYGNAPNNQAPSTPNPSEVPESFMDTMMVNGHPYPYLDVAPQAYRFRILNASNDRSVSLSVFYAVDPKSYVPATYDANGNVAVPAAGVCKSGGTAAACTEIGMVPAVPHKVPAKYPLKPTPPNEYQNMPQCGVATNLGTNFLSYLPPAVPAPLATLGWNTPVASSAFLSTTPSGLPSKTDGTPCWPTSWPTDGRDGGVPDPMTAGPAIIQIATEGGYLPSPVVIPPQPINYNYNRRDIVVLNQQEHALVVGPAERADIIIDFSKVPAGSTLILYNDSGAPVPAYDTRYDYYTDDEDETDSGGAPTTIPGYGPNTRTVMQFRVSGTPGAAANLDGLVTQLPAAFAAAEPAPVVAESAYNGPYSMSLTDTYSTIQDTQLTFTTLNKNANGTVTPQLTSMAMKAKTIQELFGTDFGRMNATLGTELPLTNFLTQTTIPLWYLDPPTEIMNDGEAQIWKITHNGVDTHAMHFHLFDVQLLNRVGWDGAIRPPDPNEVGWKETVRMNPLEDAIVAIRPLKQDLPWPIPNSVRMFDPTKPQGQPGVAGPQFTNVNPYTNGTYPTTVFPNGNVYNRNYDFGWEYVWHCHLLGHEENDMMRPMVFQTIPSPNTVAASVGTSGARITWKFSQYNPNPARYTQNGFEPAPPQATGFSLMRAPGLNATTGFTQLAGGLLNLSACTLSNQIYTCSFNDSNALAPNAYTYQVIATNATISSPPSLKASITMPAGLTAPANLRTNGTQSRSRISVTWNTVTGAQTYPLARVFAGVGGTCPVTPPGNALTVQNSASTTYTASGTITPGNWCFWIRAQANGLFSPFSAPLTVTIP